MKMTIYSVIMALFAATSLVAAPQAIVFDFGGVLTSNSNREAVVVFLQETFNLSNDDFERINQQKRLALKQGKTDEEFWVSYANAHGIKLPANWSESLRTVMKQAIGVNPKMYLLVDELRGRNIPVALLSNIDGRLAKLIRSYGLYEPFDPCLLSCDIGYMKPDVKAYNVLLTKLNLPARDIVFIDDKLENVESAKAFGLDAILFESEEQLRGDLVRRGVLSAT